MLWMFSFRGRINRLQYFFGSVGLGIGWVVIILVAGDLALGLARGGGLAGGLVGGLLLILLSLALLVGGLWSSLSLRARRIRDIGWPVGPVMGGSILLMAMNFFMGFDAATSAFQAAQASGMPPTPHLSPLSGLVSLIGLVLDLCLLFWPGNGGADPLESGWRDPSPASRPYEAALGRKAAGGAPRPQWAVDLGAAPDPVAPAPAPAATGGFPRPQTAGGSGRRGL